MESIIWGYLEERVLSVWFPAMPPKNLQQMVTLEENIRFGGKNPLFSLATISDNTTRHFGYPRTGGFLAGIHYLSPLPKPTGTIKAERSRYTSIRIGKISLPSASASKIAPRISPSRSPPFRHAPGGTTPMPARSLQCR
jgi:hypothetical protein